MANHKRQPKSDENLPCCAPRRWRPGDFNDRRRAGRLAQPRVDPGRRSRRLAIRLARASSPASPGCHAQPCALGDARETQMVARGAEASAERVAQCIARRDAEKAPACGRGRGITEPLGFPGGGSERDAGSNSGSNAGGIARRDAEKASSPRGGGGQPEPGSQPGKKGERLVDIQASREAREGGGKPIARGDAGWAPAPCKTRGGDSGSDARGEANR